MPRGGTGKFPPGGIGGGMGGPLLSGKLGGRGPPGPPKCPIIPPGGRMPMGAMGGIPGGRIPGIIRGALLLLSWLLAVLAGLTGGASANMV